MLSGTIWFAGFSVERVGSENVDIKQLRFADKFKLDISYFVQDVHREATLFLQFPREKNKNKIKL